jgi:Tfp pilus assembly protein PilF
VAQAPRDAEQGLRVLQYAMNAAARAPGTADDPQNALVNLAALRAAINDAPGVEQSLRQAIVVAPNWYKAHWLLAQVLEREGRRAEALEEARLAFDRDGGKHVEVRQTRDQLEVR